MKLKQANSIFASTANSTSVNSSVFNVHELSAFSIQINGASSTTGCSAGSAVLQYSNDQNTWFNGSPTVTLPNETGSTSYMYQIVDPTYLYARVNFGCTSGTLAATAYLASRTQNN